MSETTENKTERGTVKEAVGRVSSTKMDKTVVVKIEQRIKHPLYGKFMKRTRKLYAHDETNNCNVGDTVKLLEMRPMSKTKRWRVAAIIERAK